MTRILDKARTSVHSAEVPDVDKLRARIVEAVETAIDRIGDVIDDAPSPAESARRVRRTRAVEAASTALAAGVPIATAALRRRSTRRSAMRVARAAPLAAARSHPLLLAAALGTGAVVGAIAWRRRRRHASDEEQFVPTEDPPKQDIDRMIDEGGDPGGFELPRERRFVRSSETNTVV